MPAAKKNTARRTRPVRGVGRPKGPEAGLLAITSDAAEKIAAELVKGEEVEVTDLVEKARAERAKKRGDVFAKSIATAIGKHERNGQNRFRISFDESDGSSWAKMIG